MPQCPRLLLLVMQPGSCTARHRDWRTGDASYHATTLPVRRRLPFNPAATPGGPGPGRAKSSCYRPPGDRFRRGRHSLSWAGQDSHGPGFGTVGGRSCGCARWRPGGAAGSGQAWEIPRVRCCRGCSVRVTVSMSASPGGGGGGWASTAESHAPSGGVGGIAAGASTEGA